jgi:UDP-2-acetamido-2-deoxy-ribo-hexuluronate aminotransferase
MTNHESPTTNHQPLTTSIDFANLQYQHELYKDEIENAILKVARNCNFIMGEEVSQLEKSLEEFTGAKYAITCSNGTDALLLAMMALDIKPGDEVITTPFTFIATAETIAFLGATPVFVDIDEKTYNIDPNKIEEKITSKTKAIIPVSLYGQPADMDAIQAIVDKILTTKHQKLYTIIDGAQSFGSTYNSITDSALADISTTSFFPAKPLGCYGDGGAVFTNDEELANKMKSLRLHGQSKRYHHKYIGMGGRLDTIQAAVLNVKLKYYKKDLALRQEVANKYTKALMEKLEGRRQKDYDVVLPYIDKRTTSVWAQYSIRIKPSTFNLQPSPSLRDDLQTSLKEKGIPTAVHYPMPLHLQECFEYLGYKKGDFPISEIVSNEIMSLPMNPYASDSEIEYISNEVLKCIY